MTQRILIVAGESSGDHHAAQVIAAYQDKYPQAYFYGIAGPRMRQQGVDSLFDLESIAVMGLTEVITSCRAIWQAFQAIKQSMNKQPPDVVLLIDYPGFNLRLAKYVKRFNCPVVYYISPKIWAWKKGRIKQIQRYVDHMAVIFPFEKKLYEKAGVPVTYVGSPHMEQLDFDLTIEKAKHQLNLATSATVVGLLPGSRRSEIKRHMPILVELVKWLQSELPHREWQFVIPLANTLPIELVQAYLDDNLPIKIIPQSADQVLKACDACICASGTVTLEAALLQVPTVVIYRMSAFTFAIAKRVVDLPYVSLANIVAEKAVFPELLQNEAKPAAIAQALLPLLDNPDKRQQQLTDMQHLRDRMIASHTGANVAQLLYESLPS